MNLDKEKLKEMGLGEAGYIGEELIESSGVSELDRKCYCVEKTTESDYFTMKEALEAYQVTMEEYEDYLRRRRISN